MMISEHYLRDRAEDCSRLAGAESDLDMRGMLADLERDYRAKAAHAATGGRHETSHPLELAES